ncbi:MAG: sulfite exporter TauE/SafE family protein [Propionibacteriaceae bacterium]|jgi:uncharacterized membrane protein YfcA|nr:sulfite exporter TauE/SafE family protein [Propionibacteriaceae bacterium]
MEFAIVFLAGIGAGVVNTAVGAGSLITYPALLLAGLPPVVANVTNTVGLTPGSVAGTWAYRSELRSQKRLIVLLLPVAALGAVAGAALLLTLPSETFKFVVPILIIAAACLVGLQPLLAKSNSEVRPHHLALAVSVTGASVYGGYFSAAQGIILLGFLGIFHKGGIQTQNALKNLLQTAVNIVAAVFFLITSQVDFRHVLCVAAGSLLGAPLGAWLARRIPQLLFRAIVTVFGLAVGILLIIRG